MGELGLGFLYVELCIIRIITTYAEMPQTLLCSNQSLSYKLSNSCAIYHNPHKLCQDSEFLPILGTQASRMNELTLLPNIVRLRAAKWFQNFCEQERLFIPCLVHIFSMDLNSKLRGTLQSIYNLVILHEKSKKFFYQALSSKYSGCYIV